MKKGIFIVIDGPDGSGKATQTKLLVERLKSLGHKIETISFPQYGQKSAGPLEEYLSGKYGGPDDVGPYKGSIFFAVDRFDASKKIQDWLESGAHVIADRFVGSNMGHQGAKIKDNDERKKFFQWEQGFEHNLLGIPKPDINIILHVPTDITLELLKNRNSKHDLQKDMHEEDPNHLRAAESSYLQMAELFENYQLIECTKNNQMLSKEEIHEKIWENLSQLDKF